MEDLKGKTSYGWVELTDMVENPTDLTSGRGGIALVGTALKYYNKTEWVTLEAGESDNHKLLSATHTDATAGDVARGDIITGQGAIAKWTKLAKGTNGQILTMGAEEPGWATLSIEATELKNVADAGMGVPFIIRKTLVDLPEAGTNVLGTTHPKLRVIDVWFVATSADSGTVQLKVGQVGSIGAEITDAITISAADKGISRAGELDDAAWEVDANTGMVAVGDAGESVDGELFVMAIRVD